MRKDLSELERFCPYLTNYIVGRWNFTNKQNTPFAWYCLHSEIDGMLAVMQISAYRFKKNVDNTVQDLSLLSEIALLYGTGFIPKSTPGYISLAELVEKRRGHR